MAEAYTVQNVTTLRTKGQTQRLRGVMCAAIGDEHGRMPDGLRLLVEYERKLEPDGQTLAGGGATLPSAPSVLGTVAGHCWQTQTNILVTAHFGNIWS